MPAPTITSFTPTEGVPGLPDLGLVPGTEITVTGTSFTGVTSVVINGIPAAFIYDSSTQVRFTIPATTTAPIVITTPEGTATSATNLIVRYKPYIHFWYPQSGAVGTEVELSNGRYFGNATAVKFGSVNTSFRVISSSEIRATVPVGATTGNITVVNPDGTSNTKPFTVAVTPPPAGTAQVILDGPAVSFPFTLEGGDHPYGINIYDADDTLIATPLLDGTAHNGYTAQFFEGQFTVSAATPAVTGLGYYVTYYDGYGYKAFFDVVANPNNPPSAPGSPTFSLIKATSVRVNLPAKPSDAVSLTLRRSDDDGVTYHDLPAGSNIPGFAYYDDSGLNPNKKYYYLVIANNGNGNTPGTPSGVTTAIVQLAPGKPERLGVRNLQDVTVEVLTPPLPSDTDHFIIQKSSDLGATWADVSGLTNLLAGVWNTISSLTASTRYLLRAIAVGPSGLTTTGTEETDITTAAVPGAVTAPATPNAPTLGAAGKTRTSVSIKQAAWPATTTEMRLYRKLSTELDAAYVLVHTYESSGEGDRLDNNLTPGLTYHYALKAHNASGDSAYSTHLAVALVSGIALVIDSPPAGDAISGIETVEFHAADNNPLLNPAASLGGLSLGTPTLKAGSANHYEVTFDSRDYPNGAQTLLVSGTPSDGMDATTSQTNTVDNTLQNLIEYQDFLYNATRTGQHQRELHLHNEIYALPINPARRYWLQWGIRSNLTPGGNLDADLTFEAWLKHKLVEIQSGQHWDAQGARIERTQLDATVVLPYPGANIRLREKLTPIEALSSYETGTTKITKTRKVSDGLCFVFGITPAKLFSYDGSSLTEVVDFADYDLEDATDATKQGQFIYAVVDDELWRIDRTRTTDKYVKITIGGEDRPVAFVEAIGDAVIVICVDAGLGSNRSTAYKVDVDGSYVPLWTLNDAVTLTATADGKLGLAAGTKLYSSDAGTAAPTLTNTFAANITALDDTLTGLTSGAIWRKKTDNTWALASTLGSAVRALSVGAIGSDVARGFAGRDAATLYAQSANPTAWLVDRTVEVPTGLGGGNIDRISSLFDYVKTLTPASADEEAAVLEQMLIGTGDDGLLYVLEKSTQPPGSVLAGGFAGISGVPVDWKRV